MSEASQIKACLSHTFSGVVGDMSQICKCLCLVSKKRHIGTQIAQQSQLLIGVVSVSNLAAAPQMFTSVSVHIAHYVAIKLSEQP